MTEDEQRGTLQKPAHPMPGWLAIAQVPDPDKDGEDKAGKIETFDVGGMIVASVFGTPPGIRAGIVIEVGPLSDHVQEHMLFPEFDHGYTVYYHDDRGIEIGAYHYIQMTSVLAYMEAPE